MNKIAVSVALVAVLGGGAWYYWSNRAEAAETAAPAGSGAGGRGGRGGARQAMSVETAAASRHDVVDYVTVVGNLIGEATVDVVPREAGRI
jgi:multidrug efflux pump subunit AcrA (membrane-fusion protein)